MSFSQFEMDVMQEGEIKGGIKYSYDMIKELGLFTEEEVVQKVCKKFNIDENYLYQLLGERGGL